MGTPVPPGDQARYKQEVKEGIEIAQKSFHELEQTKNFPQKAELLDRAFREALHAVQGAARGLMNQKILDEKGQLDKDYSAYVSDSSAENREKVEKDLENLKKSAE